MPKMKSNRGHTQRIQMITLFRLCIHQSLMNTAAGILNRLKGISHHKGTEGSSTNSKPLRWQRSAHGLCWLFPNSMLELPFPNVSNCSYACHKQLHFDEVFLTYL